MADLSLVLADFRRQFPALAAASDVVITMYFGIATDYVSATNYGVLRDNSRQFALYLMTAHLLQIANEISAGSPTGTLVSGTIDGVSVTLMQPSIASDLKFWLNQTPYGQQLLALISAKAAFGFYTGGSSVQANIRKSNGEF